MEKFTWGSSCSKFRSQTNVRLVSICKSINQHSAANVLINFSFSITIRFQFEFWILQFLEKIIKTYVWRLIYWHLSTFLYGIFTFVWFFCGKIRISKFLEKFSKNIMVGWYITICLQSLIRLLILIWDNRSWKTICYLCKYTFFHLMCILSFALILQ